jgi:2,4-dienoyl-CoA reductase-like NADH-dependent reductase (Old Yellow Enzyme family)
MTDLFTPGQIGNLRLPNRIIRSATAERLANPDGRPTPRLQELYQELAQGGVGLIITGHMYVHPSGKAHEEMIGIYDDHLIPDLALLADTVHSKGGRIAVQLNHGGMKCNQSILSEVLGPSIVDHEFVRTPTKALTLSEIADLAQAYGQAAKRAKTAGFDAVQIHGAHGYLISQFLSPLTNRRSDRYGGEIKDRIRFLQDVCQAIRKQVGPEYPVLIKLGMLDGIPGGLNVEESVDVVAALGRMGINGIEISGGFDTRPRLNIQKGIRSEEREAYFLPMARTARRVTSLPIILVGGFRSRKVMERTLQDGHVDFISLCRPLISEPDLPMKFQRGVQTKSRCISANNCWPTNLQEGIACKCPLDDVIQVTSR